MNIKVDSRKIKKGDIFVSLNNCKEYIKQALNLGASKIITDKKIKGIKTTIVDNSHKYLEEYLYKNYYKYLKNIKLIGVTGTNGKTTIAYLTYQILKKIGIKSAYIGTIGFYTNKKEKDLNNTTPDILEIYEILLKCAYKNIEYVIIEVSSHSLDQNRLKGLKFDFAIFTNLTQDHLDYHKTMENYALAKQKLFQNLKHKGIAIINIDSNYKDYFLLKENKNITYGFNKSDYQIKKYKTTKKGSKFKIKYNKNKEKYKTNLIGKYNIYNLIPVIIILKQLKIKKLKKIILNLEEPKGRMEKIKYKNNLIIIDYAHTPDAVLNIIKTIKELKPNKIYTLIGCGGDRDKTKRGEMALISTKLSDYVIFTSDNPRTEDPNKIIEDMICKLNSSNYEIIVNREKAINRAIQLLKKSDILLLLGKGHENYQIIGYEKKYFNDKEMAEKYIKYRR